MKRYVKMFLKTEINIKSSSMMLKSGLELVVSQDDEILVLGF